MGLEIEVIEVSFIPFEESDYHRDRIDLFKYKMKWFFDDTWSPMISGKVLVTFQYNPVTGKFTKKSY